MAAGASQRRGRSADSLALLFLIEVFIDVDANAPQPTPDALADVQRQATELIVSAPSSGPRSRQPRGLTALPPLLPRGLMALPPAEVQQLRHDVREWLEKLLIWHPGEEAPEICGPRITISPVAAARAPSVLWVKGAPADVFWFHVVSLLGRVGLEAIDVCRAPKAYGGLVPCQRLFVRRGRAKLYCSERCRDRVATRRARGIPLEW